MKLRNSYLIILAVVLLVSPILMRYFNNDPLVSGDRPYRDLVVAGSFSNDIILENNFSLLDKYVFVNPYQVLLSYLSRIIPPDMAAILLSSLSMMFALFILIALLKSFSVYELENFFIVLCFILSPIFISAGVFPTYYSFVLFLYISGVYLFCNKDGLFFQLLAVFIFSLNALFGLAHALMVFVTAIVISEIFHEGFKDRKYFYFAFVPLFFLIAGCQLFVIFYGSVGFDVNVSLNNFVSDFGSDFGFGVFSLLLSFVGIIVIWSYKRKYYALYTLFIASILKSFLVNELAIYSSITIAVLGGLGFSYFFRRRWDIIELKNVVLLLLFCGLLFSCIAYIKNVVDNDPNKELADALVWAGNNSNEYSVVFSHPYYGFWIEYFSGRKVFLDADFYNSRNYGELANSSDVLLNNYNIGVLRNMLANYNISHVMISGRMKSGLVWNKAGQGLDFMKTDEETFKKVYNSSSIEFFEVFIKELS